MLLSKRRGRYGDGLGHLPAGKNVIPYPLAGIRGYLDGEPFGVFGWSSS